MMRNKINDGLLFAYYGKLLNKHQYEISKLYYDCDMSLSEISEISGITRQGVREIIIRSIKKLEEYEKNIGLILKIKKFINSIDSIIENMDNSDCNKKELQKILLEFKEV